MGCNMAGPVANSQTDAHSVRRVKKVSPLALAAREKAQYRTNQPALNGRPDEEHPYSDRCLDKAYDSNGGQGRYLTPQKRAPDHSKPRGMGMSNFLKKIKDVRSSSASKRSQSDG